MIGNAALGNLRSSFVHAYMHAAHRVRYAEETGDWDQIPEMALLLIGNTAAEF